jgi:hypothetical protein
MKARTFTCFALLMISYANAQETAVKQKNTRVSVYLHPFSTYTGILEMNPIYLTVEVPFSLFNSLIIRPSLLNSNKDEYDNVFRLGSDIGFRHHLNEKGEGLYLQGQIGIFYYKRIDTDTKGGDDVIVGPFDFALAPFSDRHISKKSIWLDIMGYFGYSLKFSMVSMFFDIGFGVALFHKILPDINVGIGIPF